MADTEDCTDQEIELLEQERIDRRQDNQRKMAWVALLSMLGFTALIFLPLVPKDRIDVFTSIADLFYLANAGVISAYMGTEAWVNKTQKQRIRGSGTRGPSPSRHNKDRGTP